MEFRKGRGRLPGGGAPELASKDSATGLSGETGLTPVWAMGSAGEKRGIRHVADRPDHGRRASPGLQTDRSWGPNCKPGFRVKLVLCIQPILSHRPFSPRPGKLGGQLTWMILVVTTGSRRWQDSLIPYGNGGRGEGQSQCTQGILAATPNSLTVSLFLRQGCCNYLTDVLKIK